MGRRGGKGLIAALTAVFLACFKDYSRHLAPGEVATVMVIAADRKQARVILRYVNGFLDGVPMLSAMVANRTKESIELNNRIAIEVHTASYRTTRGYSGGNRPYPDCGILIYQDRRAHRRHNVDGRVCFWQAQGGPISMALSVLRAGR